MLKIDFSNLIDNRLSYDIESSKPIVNVLAKNGKFQIRQSAVLTSVVKDDTLFADLPVMEENVYLNIPKIPFVIFKYISLFFREVYTKDKTEATAMVFYDKTVNEFTIFVPAQKNSSAASNYEREKDPQYAQLIKEQLLVMVAHSHPWATATGPNPSGTDNNDEKESILYMILGNVEKIPTVTLSTCPNGKRVFLRGTSIFELPEIDRETMLTMIDDCGLPSIYSSLLKNHGTDEELRSIIQDHYEFHEILESNFDQVNVTIPAEWHARCETVKPVNYSTTSTVGQSWREPLGLPEDRYSRNYYTNSSYHQQDLFDDDEVRNFFEEALS